MAVAPDRPAPAAVTGAGVTLARLVLPLPAGGVERDALDTLGRELTREATDLKRALNTGASVGTPADFTFRMARMHEAWLRRLENLGQGEAAKRLRRVYAEAENRLQGATALVHVAVFVMDNWEQLGGALQGVERADELWQAHLTARKESAKSEKALGISNVYAAQPSVAQSAAPLAPVAMAPCQQWPAQTWGAPVYYPVGQMHGMAAPMQQQQYAGGYGGPGPVSTVDSRDARKAGGVRPRTRGGGGGQRQEASQATGHGASVGPRNRYYQALARGRQTYPLVEGCLACHVTNEPGDGKHKFMDCPFKERATVLLGFPVVG